MGLISRDQIDEESHIMFMDPNSPLDSTSSADQFRAIETILGRANIGQLFFPSNAPSMPPNALQEGREFIGSVGEIGVPDFYSLVDPASDQRHDMLPVSSNTGLNALPEDQITRERALSSGFTSIKDRVRQLLTRLDSPFKPGGELDYNNPSTPKPSTLDRQGIIMLALAGAGIVYLATSR